MPPPAAARTVHRAPVAALTRPLWPQLDPDVPLLPPNADATVPKFTASSPQNHPNPASAGAARHRRALVHDCDAPSTPDEQQRTDRAGSVAPYPYAGWTGGT